MHEISPKKVMFEFSNVDNILVLIFVFNTNLVTFKKYNFYYKSHYLGMEIVSSHFLSIFHPPNPSAISKIKNYINSKTTYYEGASILL